MVSCWKWKHKWTKWIVTNVFTGQTNGNWPIKTVHQERTCEICGYKQIEVKSHWPLGG